jgi:hypothetical protein
MFVWVYLGLSTAVNCYQTATKPATLWPQIAQKSCSERRPRQGSNLRPAA